MRFLRSLLLLLMLAFLALSPGWLVKNLARNPYLEWHEKTPPSWQGRITLWHIASFRTYQGKVTEHLKKRAYAYCKQHYNVHIDVTGLTVEQYLERTARGEFPDAYSFQTGLLYREQLRNFTPDTGRLLPNVPPAQAEGRVYAVPYLMSGYFLAGNTQLMANRGVSLPKEADPALLQELTDACGDPVLSMPPVLAARAGLVCSLLPEEDFLSGKGMLALLDARKLGDLNRAAGQNMALETLPWPAYTDEVFYIGPAKTADDGQAAALADFADFLLSDGEQARLTALGAMPVTKAPPDTAFSEPLLSAYYQSLTETVVPEPFSYQRNKEALHAEAAAAVAGDAFAASSFFERMQVVERGVF